MGIKKTVGHLSLGLRKRFLNEGSKLRRAYAYYRKYRKRILISIFLGSHLAGALSSIDAVMQTRTPQGAIAWAVCLNTFPYVAVPAYWVFGHNDFEEYTDARKRIEAEANVYQRELPKLGAEHPMLPTSDGPAMRILEKIAGAPALAGNEVELLIDGEAIMASMCEAIAEAEEYVIVQFYIYRADATGKRLASCLRDCTARGVRVYFLYDAYGSMKTANSFFSALTDDSIEVAEFRSERDGPVDLEVNYRNHRKLIVIDGKSGFVGGMNVGDEYLSKDEEIGYWRDTHMKITGPVVPYMQQQLAIDWRWATGENLEGLNWEPQTGSGRATGLALATGPSDEMEHCALMFQAAILSAKERVWISSPYFAPDDAVTSALTLAALKGVDVRVLIPEKGDSFPAHQATYSYLPEMDRAGVKIYRYSKGVLHQKAVLVDDELAIIGSANFDNRSFRLNFELMVAIWHDQPFIDRVAKMFETDFGDAYPASAADMEEAPFSLRLSSKVFRLLAPIN